MSIYAETANSFYISPRKIAAGFLIAASLALVTARCGSDNNNDGGRPSSPIDTNGTRGSGYTPPGGWGGRYMPKGLGPMEAELKVQDGPDVEHVATPQEDPASLKSVVALGEAISSFTVIIEVPDLQEEIEAA